MIRKRRTTVDETIEAGQDSFLDIVSNMVGILIILVVIAGLRAKNLPPVTKHDEVKVAAAAENFDQQMADYNAISRECLELTQIYEARKTQYALHESEYRRILDYHAKLEAAIQTYMKTQDTDSQVQFELQRQMSELDTMLETLRRSREQVSLKKPDTIILENIPTPISSNANEEKEVHFRILNGRVSHVPFRFLFSQLESEMLRRRSDFATQTRITGAVGPTDGYRMQYSVIRRDLPMNMAQEMGTRSIVTLERCEMVPVESDRTIGEPLEDALKTNSAFNLCLLGCRQNEYSVTVWVYPDSFSEFQTLKRYLHQSGYRLAARPMDFGQPISASPNGTKSSNQ